MDICTVTHSMSEIYITWKPDGSKNYKITLRDHSNKILIQTNTTNNFFNKKYCFTTGQYTIQVNDVVIYSIVPSLCRLSTGGCGSLISGSLFGLDRPVIMTANHCIPNTDIAKNCKVFFNNILIELRPDIFWQSSPRCKDGGLDYSIIGIKTDDILNLRNNGIFPHTISKDSFAASMNIGLIPFYRYDYGDLCKTVISIKDGVGNFIKYDYYTNFLPTGGGASGSPVFGFDSQYNLTIQGLHIAHGKATVISAIAFQIRNNLIDVQSRSK